MRERIEGRGGGGGNRGVGDRGDGGGKEWRGWWEGRRGEWRRRKDWVGGWEGGEGGLRGDGRGGRRRGNVM